MQKMPQGTNGSSRARPASSASSASSGSSSKHVKCIGRYVLTGSTLGKGNFARVEAAVHTLTRSKVGEMYLWGSSVCRRKVVADLGETGLLIEVALF